MLRARLTLLKNDKFLQMRLKMETGPDGKAHKVNFYYINFKTFVNVIKYKLDLMRKRLETEERDATSRASFKCTNCSKAFTDLEVDQLFDFTSGEFSCQFCSPLRFGPKLIVFSYFKAYSVVVLLWKTYRRCLKRTPD